MGAREKSMSLCVCENGNVTHGERSKDESELMHGWDGQRMMTQLKCNIVKNEGGDAITDTT